MDTYRKHIYNIFIHTITPSDNNTFDDGGVRRKEQSTRMRVRLYLNVIGSKCCNPLFYFIFLLSVIL